MSTLSSRMWFPQHALLFEDERGLYNLWEAFIMTEAQIEIFKQRAVCWERDREGNKAFPTTNDFLYFQKSDRLSLAFSGSDSVYWECLYSVISWEGQWHLLAPCAIIYRGLGDRGTCIRQTPQYRGFHVFEGRLTEWGTSVTGDAVSFQETETDGWSFQTPIKKLFFDSERPWCFTLFQMQWVSVIIQWQRWITEA